MMPDPENQSSPDVQNATDQDEGIQSPHDRLVSQTLQQIEAARSLIDHKSTDDSHVLIQMLGYIVRIWENALANKQPLVPIVPWVLYNGVKPWRSARGLGELIPVPESWKRYVPGLELPIWKVCCVRFLKCSHGSWAPAKSRTCSIR